MQMLFYLLQLHLSILEVFSKFLHQDPLVVFLPFLFVDLPHLLVLYSEFHHCLWSLMTVFVVFHKVVLLVPFRHNLLFNTMVILPWSCPW